MARHFWSTSVMQLSFANNAIVAAKAICCRYWEVFSSNHGQKLAQPRGTGVYLVLFVFGAMSASLFEFHRQVQSVAAKAVDESKLALGTTSVKLPTDQSCQVCRNSGMIINGPACKVLVC